MNFAFVCWFPELSIPAKQNDDVCIYADIEDDLDAECVYSHSSSTSFHMMQEADTNGDGVLSLHEFATIMAKSAVEFLAEPESSSSS